jgi:DNA-directed RNA polymerase specialized sigma24 family protein
VTQQLRAQIRAGDAAAFGQAFDEHARAVYRHAVRVDGGHAGAEDVVSLTFLEAWRVRGTLRPEGDSVLPWLLGIATNVLRNRRRAARRHRAAMLRVPAATSVPDFADEVVGRLYDVDQLAAAAAALRGLRCSDREVFLLCVWSQLDYAAAARHSAFQWAPCGRGCHGHGPGCALWPMPKWHARKIRRNRPTAQDRYGMTAPHRSGSVHEEYR